MGVLFLKMKKAGIPNLIRLASVIIVCIVYVILFRFVKSTPAAPKPQEEFDATLFKLVDVMEYSAATGTSSSGKNCRGYAAG